MRRIIASAASALVVASCGQSPAPETSSLPSTDTSAAPCSASTGPALKASVSAMEGAIGYPRRWNEGRHDPVLLIHGTGSTGFESWNSTYRPALTAAGYDVFTLDLPGKAYVDIQDSTEYVVYALRRITGLTGRRVSVVTHSQGGLEPRWALRYWPDTRRLVGDFVTLGAPHHGTVIANAYCATACKPAHWQQRTDSRFVAALGKDLANYPGIDTTSVFSRNDEIVQPQLPDSTSALGGASNIAIQDLCPGRPVDHVGLMRDGAVWAVVLDALGHDGPARAERLDATICAAIFIPGIGPVESAQGNVFFATSGDSDVPDAAQEPPLKTSSCK